MALVLKDVSKSYGEKLVVDNINIEFLKPGVYGLLGTNGAGKTRKEKTAAGLLAFLFGGAGVHKFYLGEKGKGVLFLLFCWTGVPSILGVIDCIILLTMSDSDFDRKYNGTINTEAIAE